VKSEDVSDKKIRRIFSKVMDLTEEIDGNKIRIKLSEDLIVGDDVDYEIDHAALRYQFIASLAEDARLDLGFANIDYKIYKAERDAYYRDEMVKPTNEKVTGAIHREPEYLKRKKNLVVLEQRTRKLESAKEAFKMKADLIRSKGANIRNS